MRFFLLPRRKQPWANVSWATWDETIEAGWGDSANNFIALMENVAAGGNETGQGGGLGGADLILTQNGTIAGASGGKRILDGSNDAFDATANLVNGLFLGSAWTIIWKWNALASGISPINYFWNGGTDYLYADRTGGLSCYAVDSGGSKSTPATAAPIPSSGDVWVCVWYDGTFLRCGWAKRRPSKWSDFAANNRASATNALSFGGFGTRTSPVGNTAGGAFPAGGLYYWIGSKKCLIDNAA